MSTIFVTGGAGFIGSHLCERLLSEGHTVVCLDNFCDSYDPALKRGNIASLIPYSNFTLIEGDILDMPLLNRLAEEWRIDSVVHLAALAGVRRSVEIPQEYVDVDIKGTVNVLEMCRKHGIHKMIFASSSSVYGTGKLPNPKLGSNSGLGLQEGCPATIHVTTSVITPFRECDALPAQMSPYAAAKACGELFCRTWHELYGISVVCLRFFTVYGPRQRPDMAIRSFAEAILNGNEIKLYGDGLTFRDYTYVDDTVDGIIAALSLVCRFEAINLGNSSPIRLDQLVRTLEQSLGKPAQKKHLPMPAGDVPCTCADTTKANAMLGYSAKVNLEEGVRRFVDWLRQDLSEIGNICS